VKFLPSMYFHTVYQIIEEKPKKIIIFITGVHTFE